MQRCSSIFRVPATDLNGRTGQAYAILPEGYVSKGGRILAGGRIVRHEVRVLPALKERFLVLSLPGGWREFLPLFDVVDTKSIPSDSVRSAEPVYDAERGGVCAWRVRTKGGTFLVPPEEGADLQGLLAEQIRKKLRI